MGIQKETQMKCQEIKKEPKRSIFWGLQTLFIAIISIGSFFAGQLTNPKVNKILKYDQIIGDYKISSDSRIRSKSISSDTLKAFTVAKDLIYSDIAPGGHIQVDVYQQSQRLVVEVYRFPKLIPDHPYQPIDDMEGEQQYLIYTSEKISKENISIRKIDMDQDTSYKSSQEGVEIKIEKDGVIIFKVIDSFFLQRAALDSE